MRVVTHNTRTTRSTRPFLDAPHLVSPFFLSTYLLCILKQVSIAHYCTLLCSCSVCRGPVCTVPLSATLSPPVNLAVLSQSPHFQKNREKRSKRQAKSDRHLSRRAQKKGHGKSSALRTHSGELLALPRPYTLSAHCSVAYCCYSSNTPSFACTAPFFSNKRRRSSPHQSFSTSCCSCQATDCNRNANHYQ